MTPSFNLDTVRLLGATEVTYTRRGQLGTSELLAQAFKQAIAAAGLQASDIDGLGVASFTHAPDRAIDLAWKLGLKVGWIMDDSNGGASGLNILQHAIRAVQAGDARCIAIVAGDHFQAKDFQQLVENYNQTTYDHLRPLGAGSPNHRFAMLTANQMRKLGLEREDYAALVIRQRLWASLNPDAAYQSPMSLDDYLNAPQVADPLTRLDCVPVVDGANATITQGTFWNLAIFSRRQDLSKLNKARHRKVRQTTLAMLQQFLATDRAVRAQHNHGHDLILGQFRLRGVDCYRVYSGMTG